MAVFLSTSLRLLMCLVVASSTISADYALDWAGHMGGAGSSVGQGMAVDSVGNIIITGYFTGTVDFNPGAGTFNLTSAGSNDAFVLKLDSAGVFQYAVPGGRHRK